MTPGPQKALLSTPAGHPGRPLRAGLSHCGFHDQPGIIITPLANDELTGPRGEGYFRMVELSPVGHAGTLDEVGPWASCSWDQRAPCSDFSSWMEA